MEEKRRETVYSSEEQQETEFEDIVDRWDDEAEEYEEAYGEEEYAVDESSEEEESSDEEYTDEEAYGEEEYAVDESSEEEEYTVDEEYTDEGFDGEEESFDKEYGDEDGEEDDWFNFKQPINQPSDDDDRQSLYGALTGLGVILAIVIGIVFMWLSEGSCKEYDMPAYAEGRVTEVIYVAEGETESFQVRADRKELAQLERSGRVNVGIRMASTQALTENTDCLVQPVSLEDHAHRSNPQTYYVTGGKCGLTEVAFDVCYDVYSINYKGNFSSKPSQTYESSKWASTVISVYPRDLHLSIPYRKVTISQSDAFKLQIDSYDENAQYAPLVYESSNPEVAKVHETGWVTGQNPGETVISVRVDELSPIEAWCVVEVVEVEAKYYAMPEYVWSWEGDRYYHIDEHCGGMTNAKQYSYEEARERKQHTCPFCMYEYDDEDGVG